MVTKADQEIQKHSWESYKELNSISCFSSSIIIKPVIGIISLYHFVDIEQIGKNANMNALQLRPSGIKAKGTSDQVMSIMLVSVYCLILLLLIILLKESFSILISAQKLHLHVLHKVRNEHCSEHIEQLFVQQAVYWKNQYLSFYLLLPPPQIK